MAGINKSLWPSPEPPGFSHHPIWGVNRGYVEARTGTAEQEAGGPIDPYFMPSAISLDSSKLLWPDRFRFVPLKLHPLKA